jgi:hypothetical protein
MRTQTYSSMRTHPVISSMPVAVLALVALAARSLRVRAQGGWAVTLWGGARRRGGSEECEPCRISQVEVCARELLLRAIKRYFVFSQVCRALIAP